MRLTTCDALGTRQGANASTESAATRPPWAGAVEPRMMVRDEVGDPTAAAEVSKGAAQVVALAPTRLPLLLPMGHGSPVATQ